MTLRPTRENLEKIKRLTRVKRQPTNKTVNQALGLGLVILDAQAKGGAE